MFNWQGAEIALLGFDELTHFTAYQFFYLLSRNRSTSGVKPYVRATCNADADSWVAKFIEWWIDDEGYAIPSRSGVIRYFVRIEDTIEWGDTREELYERFPHLRDAERSTIPRSSSPLHLSAPRLPITRRCWRKTLPMSPR